MKGGKRLTEEELSNLIKRAENARRSGHAIVMDAFLKSLIEHLERDDEPEYCIWEEHPVFKGFFHPLCEENRASHYPGVDDIKFCPYCGKPVKGEP